MVERDKYSELTLEEALGLFFKEQYAKSIIVIAYYAEKKDVRASATLGLAFQLGLGVPIDLDQANYYLTQAANLGSGEAAHNLGTLYATKPDMDQQKAREWFIRAKEFGFNPGNDQ